MPAAPRTLLIAHRGESRDAPENTLAAIHLAWQRGARAVEIDTRLSADGDLVVIHDADTRRVGGTRLPVAAQSTAALRSLDVGAWKHRRWTGERIPRLAEVLATVPAHGTLFIEIKGGPDHVPPLARLLRPTAPRRGSLVVMSFNPSTVAAASLALEGVDRLQTCLLLTASATRGARRWSAALTRARALGCRSIDIEAHAGIDETVVAAAHTAELDLHVWTVDRLNSARRFVRLGVDGITTNRCAWLAEKLRDSHPHLR